MTGSKRRAALGLVLLIALATLLGAANLPRDTLWRVEQACMLDKRTTGSPFPCLSVDFGTGVAVLRAPLRHSHVVAMPTLRISGVEDPALRAPGPNYFQAAWNARDALREDVGRPLGWADIGLAVNSRQTRSQDQLHIHIDCVRQGVKRLLAERLAEVPTAAWSQPDFTFQRQSYWMRRVDRPTLDGLDVFALADEIPAIRAHPDRTVLAVLGVTDTSGRDGFLLLAGQSDPNRGARQSTSEDLLDHACRTG